MKLDPESKRLCSIINELFKQRKLEAQYNALPTCDPETVDINYNNWEGIVKVNGKGFARWFVGTCRNPSELLRLLRAKASRTAAPPNNNHQQ